jgi:hypothetical protein
MRSGKRKDEHFELPNNINPYPTPLEMEYEPKAPFPKHLEEPIENVVVKLNIFNSAHQQTSEKECFFLDILKKFVEASFPDIQAKYHFSLPFIDLSIYGRQHITFQSFSFCSLTDTSLTIFMMHFFYMAGVVLCFSVHMFLHRSLGDYFRPTFSFLHSIVSLSIH